MQDSSTVQTLSALRPWYHPARWQETLLQEVRDWPQWWSTLSLPHKVFPGAFVAFYWGTLHLLGGYRSDHTTLGMMILVLCYGGRSAKTFFNFMLPSIMTVIIYDSMRFYSDYIRGAIRVQEPYFFDKNFFGITTAHGVLTPNEWWQLHTHPVLDLITGFFYLAFVVMFIWIAAHFRFVVSRVGTAKRSAIQIAQEAPRVMWAFFWVNLLGYSTYYWYPAAPPWYVAQYGLGPANMNAQPSAAGCLRFDELLGTHFFTGMYGRSADIFGAVPSLHIAYPLVALLFAFRFGALRAFSVFFYLIMCFSAVYLNHHYVLDILWGSAYAILVVWLVNWWGERGKRPAPAS